MGPTTSKSAATQTAVNTATNGLRCSFCGKPEEDVDKIIAGPGIYICNQCVDACNAILTSPGSSPSDMQERPQVRPWDGMSLEEILAHLPEIASVAVQVEGSLKSWVQRARDRGATWTRIGASLGMKRQSAWKRFSDEE